MRSKKGDRKSAGYGRSLSGVFVFLLIGMYTLFSLLLVLIGAGVYQRITDAADANAQMRTSLAYVATKVRAADEAGDVSVEYVGGVPVLALGQKFGDEMFFTRIYFLPDGDGQAGALYEMFTMGDEPPELDMGERITEVSAFDVREAPGGLELSVTMADGVEQSLYLRLRTQAMI